MNSLVSDPNKAYLFTYPASSKEGPGTLAITRLTDAVFLDVTKAFVAVWVDGLLYKLRILKFLNQLNYLVENTTSNLHDRTCDASFQTATNTRCYLRAGVAQGGLLFPALFSKLSQLHACVILSRRVGPLRGRHVP